MTAKKSAFRRGARVLVSYGQVQIMQAAGSFAVGGRVVDRSHWRKGWYEVALRWDVDAQRDMTVMAHASALTLNELVRT